MYGRHIHVKYDEGRPDVDSTISQFIDSYMGRLFIQSNTSLRLPRNSIQKKKKIFQNVIPRGLYTDM
jgi:hypothetical protein